jgi:hypothetical protein
MAGGRRVAAQEAGKCGYGDPDQLALATANSRVIVTFDSDYPPLHLSGVRHAGIAWALPTKPAIGDWIQAINILHSVYTADDMLNHVEYL